MNPLLAIAEILVSIGLIAAVLLQARGAGLGATFGGESSAYRSRRGVEKTLFQFTIIMAALFVVVCMISFLTSPGDHRASRGPAAGPVLPSALAPGSETPMLAAPRWRNRQTRQVQDLVAARSCGFKSLPRYHPS